MTNPMESTLVVIEERLTRNMEWHQRHADAIQMLGHLCRKYAPALGTETTDQIFKDGLAYLRERDPDHGLGPDPRPINVLTQKPMEDPNG